MTDFNNTFRTLAQALTEANAVLNDVTYGGGSDELYRTQISPIAQADLIRSARAAATLLATVIGGHIDTEDHTTDILEDLAEDSRIVRAVNNMVSAHNDFE